MGTIGKQCSGHLGEKRNFFHGQKKLAKWSRMSRQCWLFFFFVLLKVLFIVNLYPVVKLSFRYSIKCINTNAREDSQKTWKRTWFLYHDNASALSALLIREVFADRKIPVVPYSPYSPDLAHVIVLFSRDLNLCLKDNGFKK